MTHNFSVGYKLSFPSVCLRNRDQQKENKKTISFQGDTVRLSCRSNSPWEWCRWIHYDQFCDLEWVSNGAGVAKAGCGDFSDGKIVFSGDYGGANECAVDVTGVSLGDRGLWMCEVEKYYLGFSRR